MGGGRKGGGGREGCLSLAVRRWEPRERAAWQDQLVSGVGREEGPASLLAEAALLTGGLGHTLPYCLCRAD